MTERKGRAPESVEKSMAEMRKNKFSYDRNYYENVRTAQVVGSAAKKLDAQEEYEEDFFEDSELFTEEYSEHDFESTSPRKEAEPIRDIRPSARPNERVKIKKKYNFGFIELLMLVVALVAVVHAVYGYIETKAAITQANKNIQAAKQELTDIQNKNEALIRNLDVETDRNYIYTVAVSKLNMIYPKENDTIYYETPSDGYVRQYHEIPTLKN